MWSEDNFVEWILFCLYMGTGDQSTFTNKAMDNPILFKAVVFQPHFVAVTSVPFLSFLVLLPHFMDMWAQTLETLSVGVCWYLLIFLQGHLGRERVITQNKQVVNIVCAKLIIAGACKFLLRKWAHKCLFSKFVYFMNVPYACLLPREVRRGYWVPS